ncbi:hypothetical protein [Mesorhizobium sp. LCM 4576]|uniref:hypothetical protein n=1 Tax=Mesorhizobium sp. LCM 4576 TaxID=1848289 RepID=UPI0010421015|nr:hypothetical protein [Mesorhizobium sp. LCM 4576]
MGAQEEPTTVDYNIFDEWPTETEFAKANGLTKRQVARMRSRKDGLPFAKRGKEIIIHVPTAREWLKKRLITPNPSREGRA